MRKAVFISFAALLLAALAFSANDPWKAKPYKQWDDKDIRKILGDSPWAKVIQVDATWKNNKDLAPDDSTQPAAGKNAPAGAAKMGSQAPATPSAAGGTPAAGATEPGGPVAQASFAIRWVSSRTMQRAAARSAELAGQLKEEDAEKQLAHPLDIYEIAIAGPDMRPFQGVDDDTLLKSAALIEKKTKQKIAPDKVQVSRSSDGKKIQAVAFIFPKKTGNGEPVIAQDDKSVEFTCNLNGAKIHVDFDLPKMQDNEGRDL